MNFNIVDTKDKVTAFNGYSDDNASLLYVKETKDIKTYVKNQIVKTPAKGDVLCITKNKIGNALAGPDKQQIVWMRGDSIDYTSFPIDVYDPVAVVYKVQGKTAYVVYKDVVSDENVTSSYFSKYDITKYELTATYLPSVLAPKPISARSVKLKINITATQDNPIGSNKINVIPQDSEIEFICGNIYDLVDQINALIVAQGNVPDVNDPNINDYIFCKADNYRNNGGIYTKTISSISINIITPNPITSNIKPVYWADTHNETRIFRSFNIYCSKAADSKYKNLMVTIYDVKDSDDPELTTYEFKSSACYGEGNDMSTDNIITAFGNKTSFSNTTKGACGCNFVMFKKFCNGTSGLDSSVSGIEKPSSPDVCKLSAFDKLPSLKNYFGTYDNYIKAHMYKKYGDSSTYLQYNTNFINNSAGNGKTITKNLTYEYDVNNVVTETSDVYPFATYCNNMSVNQTSLGTGTWYLPSSSDMLDIMYDITYGTVTSDTEYDVVNKTIFNLNNRQLNSGFKFKYIDATKRYITSQVLDYGKELIYYDGNTGMLSNYNMFLSKMYPAASSGPRVMIIAQVDF